MLVSTNTETGGISREILKLNKEVEFKEDKEDREQ